MSNEQQSVAQTEEANLPQITFKKRRNPKANGGLRQKATPPPADDSQSSSDDEAHVVKRRKENSGGVAVSAPAKSSSNKELFATTFAADRETSMKDSNDATKQSNWVEQDAKAPTSKSIGPTKGPTNVRMTTFTDFAPDVCKDYKLRGFCGFGDNCKFLHSREVFEQGWQLDQDWDKATKGKKDLGGTIVASADRSKRDGAAKGADKDKDAVPDNIPFVCIICDGPYKSPVVTRCRHYFCEPCALKRYRKDPTCAACSAQTNGVFNSAKDLQKMLDRKKEREAEREEKATAEG